MSAIFGTIHLDGAPAERQHLERMSAALAAHGSEGGGLWLSGPVGLGQRQMRFTPRDACERQPLVREALSLVSDARIDHRRQVMAELELEQGD